MKFILRIGYTDLLLPASANVNSLIKALADCKVLDHRYHESEDFYTPKGPPELTLKAVEDRFILDHRNRKAIPETTGGPY